MHVAKLLKRERLGWCQAPASSGIGNLLEDSRVVMGQTMRTILMRSPSFGAVGDLHGAGHRAAVPKPGG